MLQRIAAITATVGALVLGLHEGDCTAAAVMVMLFAPMLIKRKGDKNDVL